MPQKIKKQIRRSMPWLLILSLIFGTLVSGLVFNLDVKISNKINEKLGLGIGKEALASDTATTTVTVKNAPPNITNEAAEVSASTSTSPVNVGASIEFSMLADDPELNKYYLIVCSSNGVTPGAGGGAPTCSGVRYCVSDLTNSGSEARCTYENVTDPGAQTREWFAFACDNHGTEPDCSVVSQGDSVNVGDDSSPFYVNHAPVYTAINTTDNNKDPGGTFTVSASVTDPDTARGAEEMYLYVCTTDSWATSTGCAAQEICHATSTSPDIDCSFATTSPAQHGNWGYWGFVKDKFGMAATGNSRTSTYHVNNVAPTITSVTIHSGVDIRLALKNVTNVEATTTSSSIRDYNGCTDLVRATSSIFLSDVAGLENCSPNNNDCYQIGQAYCVAEPGSCTGPTDPDITYTCSTTMEFYSNPSDNSTGNPDDPNKWLGSIRVFDEEFNDATTTQFASGVDVKTNTALDVTEPQIAYGSIKSGQNSGTTNATTTIVNYGNSPLDTQLSGTYMTMAPTYVIGENWQEYSLTYEFAWSTGADLSSTTPATVDTVTPKPTSATDISDYIYWGIGIPSGQQSGNYEGMNTFAAALDDNNW